jgi:hypothetical protein
MRKSEFSLILIRLLGIYFIVLAIGALSNFGWIFTINEMNNSAENASWLTNIFTIFGPSIVYLVCGLLLLIFSKRIGFKITSGLSEEIPVIDNFKELQAVLFSVVGIWVVFSTIGQFAHSVITMISLSSAPYPDKYIRDSWFDLAANGLQVLVGVFLILQARAISKFLTNLRNWNPSN